MTGTRSPARRSTRRPMWSPTRRPTRRPTRPRSRSGRRWSSCRRSRTGTSICCSSSMTRRRCSTSRPASSTTSRASSQAAGVPGGLPNLHIGVVTTDMGTKASGSPLPAPAIGQVGQGGCGGTGQGRRAADRHRDGQRAGSCSRRGAAGGARMHELHGDLSAVFGELAQPRRGRMRVRAAARRDAGRPRQPPGEHGVPPPGGDARAWSSWPTRTTARAKSTALFGRRARALGPLQSFRCTRFGVTCTGGGQTPDAMNQVGAKSGCGRARAPRYIDDVAPYRAFLAGLKAIRGGSSSAGSSGTSRRSRSSCGRRPAAARRSRCWRTRACTRARSAPRSPIRRPGSRASSTGSRAARPPPRSASRTSPAASTSLGEAFRQTIGNSCVDVRLADVDPGAAGLQAGLRRRGRGRREPRRGPVVRGEPGRAAVLAAPVRARGLQLLASAALPARRPAGGHARSRHRHAGALPGRSLSRAGPGPGPRPGG